MLTKLMLTKLARKKHEQKEEGRGVRAPALLVGCTGLVRFVRRSGHASRGYVLAGVGVVAAAVIAVSLLSWLAPDSDRPIGHPLEVVVEQVVALIGADGETVRSSAGQGVAAAGSRIPWAGERLREIATDRSASVGPVPVARPTPNTGAPAAQGRFSSPTTSESSAPPAMREPSRESLPASGTSSSPSSSTGETTPPAAVEEPPPTTEEPPPTTEEPAPPATKQPPPIADQPALPPTDGPPPTTNQPPPPPNLPALIPPPIPTQ